MITIKNNFLITIIIVVVAAAVGFYAGTAYQKGQAANTLGSIQRRQTGAFRRGRGQGPKVTRGSIIRMDSNSLTIKLQDGSSKIVILSDKTAYVKSDKASKTDLKAGETVAVFGTDNSDGSVIAQNVQLSPMGFGANR